jgi:DNA topoisomerase-1
MRRSARPRLRTPRRRSPPTCPDHLKLYELIWKRTVACQMQHATLNTVSVDFRRRREHAAFRATGTTVIDPGFLAVYEEGRDQKSAEDEDDEGRKLPTMKVGEAVPLRDILADQHFTEPPPRYSEAAGEGAGGIRHRPSFDLCQHHPDLARPRIRHARQPPLPAHRCRPRGGSSSLANHFCALRGLRFHGAHGGRARCGKPRRRRLGAAAEPLLDAVQGTGRRQDGTVDKSEASGSRVLGVDPASGKPVSCASAASGRSRRSAPRTTKTSQVRLAAAGQSMHTISLEEALELFKLPRTLGVDENDEPVTVGIGRFGPFVKIGSTYASLAKEDDPYTIELPRALELVRARLELLANRIIKDFGNGIQILNGRYGPYITDGEKNARIPKDREPAQLTEAECAELLAAAPNRPKRGFKKGANGKAAAAKGESAKAKKAPAKKAAGKKAASKKTATAKKASGKSPARKTPARKSAVAGATKKTTRKSAGSPPIGEA